MVKNCTNCNRMKPLKEFNKASHHKDGRGSWCTICKNKKGREIYKADATKHRAFRANWRKDNPGYYLKQYWPGATANEAWINYSKLLTLQNSVCAICKKPEKHKHAKSGLVRKLSVDHCHKTGKVRGLLCSQCNRAIGAFSDEPILIKALKKYLA